MNPMVPELVLDFSFFRLSPYLATPDSSSNPSGFLLEPDGPSWMDYDLKPFWKSTSFYFILTCGSPGFIPVDPFTGSF